MYSYNPSFESLYLSNGVLYERHERHNSIRVHGLVGRNSFSCQLGTYFLFVADGRLLVDNIMLRAGMYACLTNNVIVTLPDARALIIEIPHILGMFMVGGPLEQRGRLRYIDGCTDSLLVPPVKKGWPCLNFLHFPENVNQTMHTHPSVRIGMVTRGKGECVTPFGNAPLEPGSVFIIHPEDGRKENGLDGKEYPVGAHSFRTFEDTMSLVAFHPDSDVGPTDDDHPMLSKTFVDGISAKHIEAIRTR